MRTASIEYLMCISSLCRLAWTWSCSLTLSIRWVDWHVSNCCCGSRWSRYGQTLWGGKDEFWMVLGGQPTLWFDRFFSVESNGEGPTSKFELEESQTDSKKWLGESCDISGATSQSCMVTWAIRNVHDKPESFRTWPAVVSVLRPVEFKIIPQPRILDAWHQWRNNGRVVITRDFLASFGHLFDRVPVRILTLDLHHRTRGKKAYTIRDYDFGV